ncbi:flagellar biosynthetic protein FliO [Litchfieldia alkalitelluris]|uniref:flagellar biosynthetic protein FliO n=1 Tax=Litchfieldia alkalitelluris TaxID=304268 RepID=UPI0009970EF5|nr:flagellar biosynthetic protein FliO [Litchfieldia alkalitelluris]
MNAFIKILFIFSVALFITTNVEAEDLNNNVYQYYEKSNEPKSQNQSSDPIPPDNGTNLDSQTDAPKITAWDFFKMIAAFGFVIFLLYFILKLVNKRNKLLNQHKYMETIGGTSLGNNRSIQLVKVGKQILVIGVGDSITLLKEINDHEEVSRIIEEQNQQKDHMLEPLNILKQMTKQSTQKDTSNKGNNTDFSSLLREQLSELTSGRKKIISEIEKKGINND